MILHRKTPSRVHDWDVRTLGWKSLLLFGQPLQKVGVASLSSTLENPRFRRGERGNLDLKTKKSKSLIIKNFIILYRY